MILKFLFFKPFQGLNPSIDKALFGNPKEVACGKLD